MATILQMVRQYTNLYLCRKWDNNIPLSEIQDLEYFCMDQQDVEFICDLFPFLSRDDITGYVANIGDEDYTEIYITESSRPYDLHSIYHPLEYYL